MAGEPGNLTPSPPSPIEGEGEGGANAAEEGRLLYFHPTRIVGKGSEETTG